MNTNHEIEKKDKDTQHAGAWPFVWIFGGITVALILIKVLMNLFG
jgi:hypothetical protein